MPERHGQDGTSSAVGILGGTFDPVHCAHVALARLAAERLGLREVIWIPAGQPRHRDAPRASPEHRLAMVALAIAGEPRFRLDAREASSGEASYTVPTLERLRRELGTTVPLVLLMGADALHGLAGWHRWRELFGLAHLGVATRPGHAFDTLPEPVAAEFAQRRPARTDFSEPAGSIVPFELSAGTVSATEVRGLLAANAPDAAFAGLLPPPVLDYIHRHSLYRA